jgi:hypothetical protein
MLASPNDTISLGAHRLAAIALCVALSGCTMALQNEARPGRLTTSDLKPTKATLVYGLDASQGPLSVVVARFDPPPLQNSSPQSKHYMDLRCSETEAVTPEGSTGMTYFVFDVSPGRYKVKSASAEADAPTFTVPAGRQVYIGEFVGTPDGQVPTEVQVMNHGTAFSRDLTTAKAALGPKADRLELAETGPPAPTNVIQGYLCVR